MLNKVGCYGLLLLQSWCGLSYWGKGIKVGLLRGMVNHICYPTIKVNPVLNSPSFVKVTQPPLTAGHRSM